MVHNRLVVFDVEGILIPKMRFILFEVVGRMGLWLFLKAVFFGALYNIGLVSLKDALTNLYRILKGLPLERFISSFRAVPLMPGAEHVFMELKEAGCRTALISSGIPRVALEALAERLGADYVSGLEIGLSEGHLTGEVWGEVIEPGGKAIALKKILGDRGLSSCLCIAVGDDRNNLPMFQICDLTIGYNPDFVLSRKSDYVVKGDLSEIASIVKGEHKDGIHTLSRSSIVRETIHISGFLVPLLCAYLVDRYTIVSLIFIVAMVYAVSETGRMFGTRLPIITYITSRAAGKSEFQEFVASPIFYALGIMTSLLIFPVPVGYLSIMVLTLGDGFAAVFGERFGRRPIPFNKIKRLEGTVCGLFFAFLGSLLFVDPLKALVGSVVGMVAEVLPLPVNDNLTIPLTSGLALIMVSTFL